MPTNVAARMTLAADPASLQGAVAAGILGAGPVVLGTAESCARLLEEAQERVASGREPEAVAQEIAAEVHGSGGRMPGFGHPVHRPLDPRAERILELADARGVSGPHVLLARCLRDAVGEAWGRPLTMNVSHADRRRAARPRLPRRHGEGRADPGAHGRAARPPGRGAASGRSASCMAARAEEAVEYERGDALMLAPEIEARPWAEQLALDDAVLPRAARLPLRAVALLPREARRGGGRVRGRGGRARQRSRSSRSPTSASSGRRCTRRRIRSAPTSARRRARSSGSTRRAARRGRRATSRSRPATSRTG